MEINIDQIKSLLISMPAKDVAKKLGIGRGKLFSIMKENNISINEIKKSQKPSDQEIINLYKTNNLENTAKIAKTNKHYVVKVLKRNNIKRTFTKVDNLNISKVTEYFENHTLSECGKKFGFSPDQIKRFLNKHNIDTTKHKGKSRIKIDINQLIEYYQNHNLQQCAKHFGCSTSLISMKLRQHNVDTSIHKNKISDEAKAKISESNKKRWKNTNQRQKFKEMHILSVKEITEKAQKIHGNKYDYSKTKPGNMQSKITIICPKHGEFEQNIYNHIKRNGCPECAIEKTRLTQKEFLKRAIEVHGDKYDYSKVEYVDSKTYITVICPKHGEFKQKPQNHLINNCPSCPAVISSGHQEIINYIESIINTEILINDRKAIQPYELDIYLPEYNFAIEHHGLYWHSYNFKESPEEKSKHLRKLNLCEDENIKLIQILENEWNNNKELIKSMLQSKLKSSNKIYARKCDIKKIDNQQHSRFMDKNHIQSGKGCNVAYGLFYCGKLVAVMSFNKHPKHEWEITRFANKLGHTVVGGASKLFKKFIKDHNPTQVMTFADKRYSDGNLYIQLGFELVKNTSPNYFYIKNNKIHSRQQFMKHKLKDKLEIFDPSLTEAENMFLNGYRRLWDAGHAKFIWKP